MPWNTPKQYPNVSTLTEISSSRFVNNVNVSVNTLYIFWYTIKKITKLNSQAFAIIVGTHVMSTTK